MPCRAGVDLSAADAARQHAAAAASTSLLLTPLAPAPLPQLGYNILGYLLLRFTKPRYLPLTSSAAAAAKRKRA